MDIYGHFRAAHSERKIQKKKKNMIKKEDVVTFFVSFAFCFPYNFSFGVSFRKFMV